MYGLGNPVMLVDPSGLWATSSPYQPGGDVTAHPIYDDYVGGGLTIQRELEFEPRGDFQPVRYFPNWPAENYLSDDINAPSSQFNILGHGAYNALCGSFAVAAALQNLPGISPGLLTILDVLIDYEDDDDDEGLITEAQARGYINFILLEDLAEAFGYPTSLIGDVGADNWSDYFTDGIRPNLNGIQWPIILVGFDNVELSGYTGTYRCLDDPPPASENDCQEWLSNGHFVVITGLTTTEHWNITRCGINGESHEWAWVRIFNPFVNGAEYYRAEEFFDFVAPWPLQKVLWIGF